MTQFKVGIPSLSIKIDQRQVLNFTFFLYKIRPQYDSPLDNLI